MYLHPIRLKLKLIGTFHIIINLPDLNAVDKMLNLT